MGFLGFWAILDLDYIGYWFWDFFGQNFKICRNLAFWLPTPTNLKFFFVASCLEGYAVTNINILAIFRTLMYFRLLGYFGPRLYRLLILRFFWVKFQNLSKFSILIVYPPPPPNLKFIIFESRFKAICSHKYQFFVHFPRF